MIDIIYQYYNQKEYVKELFTYYNNYIEKSFLEKIIFTIIDDNSDYSVMDYLPEHNNLNLKIYKTDYCGYNPAGAANLGCFMAETSSVCCLDMDMILYNDFVEELLQLKITDDHHYRFSLDRCTHVNLTTGQIKYKHTGWHGIMSKNNRIKYHHDERFSGNWGYHGVFMLDCLKYYGITSSYLHNKVIMPRQVFINGELYNPYSNTTESKNRKHHTAGETPDLNRNKLTNKPLYNKLLAELKAGKYQPSTPLNFNYNLIYKNI